MFRDIVLTSDFIRVRYIMLNVDLDRLKVIRCLLGRSMQKSVFQRSPLVAIFEL
jgi:hypothetical protein